MTAGYSGTPLAAKLGIKNGCRVVLIDAPDGFEAILGPLSTGVEICREPRAEADMVHLFANTRDGLFCGVAAAKKLIKQNGAIWVSWYKKASKRPSEVTEDLVREAAFPLGLVDVKVCAVDENWSGLKLVIRRENRV